MAVRAFTGTSTGNVYNVGQLYQSAGEVYRAMSDGSFRNVETGRVNVGSSQDPRVTFFHTPSSLASSSGGSSGAGGGPGYGGTTTSDQARTGGPGNGAATIAGTVSASAKLGVGFYASGEVLVVKKGSSLAQISGGKAVKSGGPQLGFGEFGTVENQPLKRVGNGGYMDPGTVSDVGWFKTRNGYALTYSEAAKERTEDDFIQQVGWSLRNNIGPSIVRDPIRPPGLPEHGWQWNFLTQEWVPDGGRYEREQEVLREMDDYRANGVMAPLSPKHEWGAPAPWLK